MKIEYDSEEYMPEPLYCKPLVDNADGSVTAAFRGCKHLDYSGTGETLSLVSVGELSSNENKFYACHQSGNKDPMQKCTLKKSNNGYLEYGFSCVRDRGNAMCGKYDEIDHVVTFVERNRG